MRDRMTLCSLMNITYGVRSWLQKSYTPSNNG